MIKEHGLLEDIKREIEIMYQMKNDHIVKLYNHFEDDFKVYLLLEYVSGGTLYDEFGKRVRKNGRIPELQASRYLKEIIEAMKCMHASKVIHRDIKPENVLLDSDGRVKLADFGFACYDTGKEASEKLCGTPIYCAPEMIVGVVQHVALDKWSLGVLLFEMLTGCVPFEAKSQKELFGNILNMRIQWPKNITPDAKDLISKLLVKDPEQRL